MGIVQKMKITHRMKKSLLRKTMELDGNTDGVLGDGWKMANFA